MTVRIDAAAGVVVDGEDAWPLRLDCRTGGAVLTLRDRELAVAPLRWRDKQRLARWAHLGALFVNEQLAALGVAPGTVLDDGDRTVVGAVVTFLDGDGLPLDPRLLSRVAVEAWQATGLTPADLDHRDAREVELIWRAARASDSTPDPAPLPSAPGPAFGMDEDDTGRSPRAAPAPDPWADATRILFAPPVDAPGTAMSAPPPPSRPTPSPSRPAPSPAPSPSLPVPSRYGVAPSVPLPLADRRTDPPPRPASPPERTPASSPVTARVVSPEPVPGRRAAPAGPGQAGAKATATLPSSVAEPVPLTPGLTVVGQPTAIPGPPPDPGAGREMVTGPTPRLRAEVSRAVAGALEEDLDVLIAAVVERIAEHLTAAAGALGIEV